jgi:hypothetical protein
MGYRTAGVAVLVCVLAIGVASMPQSASAQCDQLVSRPIDLGVSGGNIRSFGTVNGKRACFSGTLGSMVQDSSNDQFILSCNHVLTKTLNNGEVGDLIVQPGLASNEIKCHKDPSDAVATFTSAVKVKLGGSAKNTVDAAIAAVTPGDVTADIANIGAIADTIVAPTIGLGVQKMGSTTCLTGGTISQVGAHGLVSYGGGKVAKFVDQFVIQGNFSDAGDSGSLIVTLGGCPQAVGLLFAGAPATNRHPGVTVANPIADVLSALNVSMVGGCTASAAVPQVVAGAASIGMPKEVVDSATSVRDRHEDALMSIPGAVGTAIGASDQPGHPAIVVYLKKMTPEAQAAAPKTVEGMPVKLIESGEFVAY